mmetsp:Transcript_3451/g.2281  ORF Transcript_3451/g.2281 Transcript_3451/m.2281 type:complete len:130 (+) Transcript_3451:995-1384(+)
MFYIIGTTRDSADEKLLSSIKERAFALNISQSVEFKVSLPWSEVLQIFSRAKVAIHTMKLEHFGISIVEMMAAGLITIAHNSGGPKLDIIGGYRDGIVGYLATEVDAYAEHVVFGMTNYDNSFHDNLRR